MRAPTLTLILLTLGTASAASFAGFSIKPTGDQKLNIQTGTTVLAQGGSATDSGSGLVMAGSYIEYKDGDFLRAKGATLTTREGGKMTADTAEYNAKTGELTASGHISYSDGRVKNLTADSATILSKQNVVVARGSVKSATPAMNANTVAVDYKGNRAVMYGNYRYSYQGTSVSSARSDGTLFVTWDAQGKPSVTTKPSPDQLAAFRAYLR